MRSWNTSRFALVPHPSTYQEIPQHKGYPSYLDHCSDISPINPTFNYMFLTCAVQYTVTFSCILPVTLYLSSRSTILTSTSTIVLTHFPLSPVKRSTFKQPILFSVLSHQAPGKHNISNNKIILRVLQLLLDLASISVILRFVRQ